MLEPRLQGLFLVDLCRGLSMNQMANLVIIELGFALLLMELQLDEAIDPIVQLVHTEIGGLIQSKMLD